MGDWNLRRAEPRDAAALSACIKAAYAEHAARISDLPDVSADCAGDIARHQVWVAAIEEDIAGCLVLMTEEGFLRLVNVAVHPDRRGGGLGRALIALAEREAAAQGYRELRLTTHAELPENLTLYSHLGWWEAGRSGNKVSMSKTLSP